MALYIPHSIFHLERLLYVRPETLGPYYVILSMRIHRFLKNSRNYLKILGARRVTRNNFRNQKPENNAPHHPKFR